MYIEFEGAIFKGSRRLFPEEVWNDGQQAWTPYTGQVPKPVAWGNVIAEVEALRWIEAAGTGPRTIGEDMELDPWKYDGYDGGREEPKPGPLAHLDLRARKRAEVAAANAVLAHIDGYDFGSAED